MPGGASYDIERLQEIAQARELLLRGLIVNAIDDGRAFTFERLGRGDVGLDHELLDQAVCGEPLRRHDAGDLPLLVEHDLALGQIEIEGRALVARLS